MKRLPPSIKDFCISLIVLCVSFGISLLLQYVFQVREHITTVFVFAVFLVSLVTRGYLWGIVTSFIGAVAVNYAFTFPYFSINFTIPVNLISAVIMITVSLLTSALTTKLKRYEAAKAESEKEGMRANLLRAISHDLRTPLTTIYGSSTTILENGDSLTDAQKIKMIRGIIVIFATNRPYDLDPAFLRPGRLPNHCYIPLPDLEVRRTFLRKLVEKRPCQGTIDIEELARQTERFSCADLVNLVKRSCQRPINRSIRRKHAGETAPEEFLAQEDLNLALGALHPSVEPEEIARLEKWMKKVGMAYPAA